MLNNDKLLNNLIGESRLVDNALQWNFLKRDNIINQYGLKIPIDGYKHIFIVLTKRVLNSKGDLNFYMEVFMTEYGKTKFPIGDYVPDNDSYHYRHIKSIYMYQYPNLITLYSIIKFYNILNFQIGKKEYVKNLYKWTEDGLLTWYKDEFDNYICYDLQFNKVKSFITVLQSDNIFFELVNDQTNVFINFIDNDDVKIYSLIDKKFGS